MCVYRWLYNALDRYGKRKVIMYALAIALFVAVVTIVPNLSNWYPQWVQQTNTPDFFKRMPFLPMWAMIFLIGFATIFLIYASVREHKIQKSKRDELRDELKIIKERIEFLEGKRQ